MIISAGEPLKLGSLNNSELHVLSKNLSYIYIEIIEKAALEFSLKYKLPSEALKSILRIAIVPITHCFFERLIRLNGIVNSSEVKPTIYEEEFFPIPSCIEDFQSQNNSSIKFNQSVLVYLSEVWDLEKIAGNNIDELKLQQVTKNNLFKISKSKFNLANLFKLIDRVTQWIPAFNRLPVLSFSNSENALYKHFFYITHLKKVNNGWSHVPVKTDNDAREQLFNKSLVESSKVNIFLSSHGFSDDQKKVISRLYLNFLKLSFPLQYLEGLQDNIKEAKNALVPFKVSSLLYSGSTSTNTLFIIAIAKSIGFKIINSQHGGHYGYQLNNSSFVEAEWALNDEFLTWGWSTLPKHPAIKDLKTNAMPSPWLSERKCYWKDLVIDSPKRFDVLWMPHSIKQFTQALPAVSANRIENIGECSNSMIDFISNASKSKIKVCCKPCDLFTLHLMKDTYKLVTKIGGNFFELSEQLDKGLNYDLLESCSIVLWDQPGTGFMECISSGIPTMILWPPYYEEEKWAKYDFICLEEVGVIHRDSQSLVKEIQLFLIDPIAWMNDLNRKAVIERFSYKYAFSDDKWWKSWRTYLKHLKSEHN